MLSGELRSMQVNGGRLSVCIDHNVKTYDTNLVFLSEYSNYTWGALDANDAAFSSDGTLWVAHPWDGMVELTPSGDRVHKFSSLASGDNVYRLVPSTNNMMLCPGGHTTTYANTYLEPDLFIATGRDWTSLDKDNCRLNGKYDVVDAAVNPCNNAETAVALFLLVSSSR